MVYLHPLLFGSSIFEQVAVFDGARVLSLFSAMTGGNSKTLRW